MKEGEHHLELQRLRCLREIEHSALFALEEDAVAIVAIRYLSDLVPDCRACFIISLDIETQLPKILASDASADLHSLDLSGRNQSGGGAYDLLSFYNAVLAGNNPDQPEITTSRLAGTLVIDDLSGLQGLNPLQEWLLSSGIRSYLSASLNWQEQQLGRMLISSSLPNAFLAEDIEFAQQVANSLAAALFHIRSRKMEQKRRQEAEVVRDLVTSLATAANLKQTLELILVNLHNLIQYDRAGLFLAGEVERYFMVDRLTQIDGRSLRAFPDDDPFILEFLRTRQPILVTDVQLDERFSSWEDMGSVRGWMGAPLFVGDDLIGFLSIGSLRVAAYSQTDADLMQIFASQIAEIMRRAWRYEQTQVRTEELEVLSNISVALDQAEDRENTFTTIIDQIKRYTGAEEVVFLLPDDVENSLVVKFSTNLTGVGTHLAQADDIFWQVITTGETMIAPDVQVFLSGPLEPFFRLQFPRARSLIVLPLKSTESTFGILGLGFSEKRNIVSRNVQLLNAIAAIAGSYLRRVVVLETLERQISIRTQHLSTLYRINAVASEPGDLDSILDQVMMVTIESMHSNAGAIHLVDERSNELYLVAQGNIPLDVQEPFRNLSATDGFWYSILESTNPVVIPDIEARDDLPVEIRRLSEMGNRAFIGTPIRTKGKTLGLLSNFVASVMDFTIEDVTVYMTIADQIGRLIERARLSKLAEQSAIMEERQRLARELHDSATQLLYGQVLFAGAGLKVLRHGELDLAEKHLTRIDQAAQQALKEMRLLVYQLRPADYLDEGLVVAIERRLDAVERRSGIQAFVEVDCELLLDETTQIALYRIAEEALNNTLKYAAAGLVTVKISKVDDNIWLEIHDDGQGFDLAQVQKRGGGMGLINMRQRAASCNASLEIDTAPGKGTSVIVRL